MTLRISADVGQLRTKPKLRALKGAVRRINELRGPTPTADGSFRVVHFSLQSTHVHLIVEARDSDTLSRGMRAFSISLARRLNTIVGRTGHVLRDRYHATELTTPRQTRAAIAYVLLNFRHHDPNPKPNTFVDPCSSGASFDGWSTHTTLPPWHVDPDEDLGPCTVPAKTWFLRKGWRDHHPLISPSEIPGPP